MITVLMVVVIVMMMRFNNFTGCIDVFIKMKSRFLALKMTVIKHSKLKQNCLVTCSDILVRNLSNVTNVTKHLYVSTILNDIIGYTQVRERSSMW